MNILFWSKKTKKILKENEDRIFLLAEDQQKALVERMALDPKNEKYIDPKEFQKALLKENNELKILFDEQQEEISKKLRSGGNYVFEMGKATFTIIPNVKVLPDNKIKLGKKREIDIEAPEKVGRLKGFFKTIQFRAWFVEPEGEYTYDPVDETPIEIKKRTELALRLRNKITKAGFIETILSELGKLKKWWDYIPWIVFGFTISVIIITVFWTLSGYNLIKS